MKLKWNKMKLMNCLWNWTSKYIKKTYYVAMNCLWNWTSKWWNEIEMRWNEIDKMPLSKHMKCLWTSIQKKTWARNYLHGWKKIKRSLHFREESGFRKFCLFPPRSNTNYQKLQHNKNRGSVAFTPLVKDWTNAQKNELLWYDNS